MGIFLVLAGLLMAWAYSLNVGTKLKTQLVFDYGHAAHLPALSLPVTGTDAVLALICIAAGAVLAARPKAGRTYLVFAVGFLAFGLGTVIWASRGTHEPIVGLLAGTFVDAVPLVFGSMAGVIGERAGVINISIEGQFIAGAFLSAMIASVTHNLWIGMVGGAAGGVLMGIILAVFALRYQADQVIVGVVIVTFATGLTNFLTEQVLNNHQTTLNSPSVFANLAIPGLDRIPILGPIFFDENVFFYLAAAILIVLSVSLRATRWGLRVRAVGEHPMAAETVGINVIAIRYRNVIMGGIIGGLGGAAFTIGSTGQFAEGITAGFGYVALAAMIFGRWDPVKAAAACLLFGFADSLQAHLAILNTPIPSPFLLMAPYVVCIVAVAGLVGRVRPPAADGVPYKRD
jgi:ABC-type uncharacterized transport system permease subunit